MRKSFIKEVTFERWVGSHKVEMGGKYITWALKVMTKGQKKKKVKDESREEQRNANVI